MNQFDVIEAGVETPSRNDDDMTICRRMVRRVVVVSMSWGRWRMDCPSA